MHRVIPALLAAAALLLPGAARAWPDRSVTIVANFGPGSSQDVLARLLAPKLQAAWGQPVVVDNRVGAAGVIGVDRVAKSAPDGHTLVLTGDAAIVVRVSMDPKPPYESQRDLAPITQLAITPNILVVPPSVPARNLQELVALARARPGSLSFAHAGNGTSQHIGGALLAQLSGTELIAAAYNDSGQQTQDVISGRVTMTFGSVVTQMPRVREGQVRALGVSSANRVAAAPDIPTIAEQGFPDFVAVAWLGLMAPAGTPAPVIARIHRDTVAALREPDAAARLAELGVETVGSSPAEFAALIRQEIPRMAGILEKAGLRAP